MDGWMRLYLQSGQWPTDELLSLESNSAALHSGVKSTFSYLQPSRVNRFVLEGELDESYYFTSDAVPYMNELIRNLSARMQRLGNGWSELATLKGIIVALMLMFNARQSQSTVNGCQLTLYPGCDENDLPISPSDLATNQVVVTALAAVTRPVASEIPELSTQEFITNGLVPQSLYCSNPKTVDFGSFRVLISGKVVARLLETENPPQSLLAVPRADFDDRLEFEKCACASVLHSDSGPRQLHAKLPEVLPPGLKRWCTP